MTMVPQTLRRLPASTPRGAAEATTYALTAACALAAGSTASSAPAAAQQAATPLPAVTVDAPTPRKATVAPKPSAQQSKARTALRRKARERTRTASSATGSASSAASTTLPVFTRAANADPYADAAAPYKADRVASRKFSEPILNTPKTITVLTKEVLADKNATTLREVGRSTAGVTLGTGEGGSAFGDRFFIRGFDARNDVFIDGIRDPGVSIRENFFTEQVEILRGPGSSYAGRGTTGGAINIVTKQAGPVNFANVETQLGSDQTKRVTIDVNRTISPVLDVRLNGLFQDANVAGRDFVVDDRNGVAGAVAFHPTANFNITANYVHDYLSGLPDFGVPTNPRTGRPATESLVPRNTYYGFVNRDFTKTTQNIGTFTEEYRFSDALVLSNKTRQEYSILNYIGTIPESPNATTNTITANAQSRFQTTQVLADDPELTLKYDTGAIRNTAIAGADFSRERVSIDSYTGLASENFGSGFNSRGSLTESIFAPLNNQSGFPMPGLTGNPDVITVDTKSGYLIHTSNWRDLVIVNGGIRYDDYGINSRQSGRAVGLDSGFVNYNAGLVVKPLPAWSLYGAYATSSNPVGAELDGTSASYGGLAPTSTVNQVFAPQQNRAYEVGSKYEFFNRHLLTQVALFQTDVTNARETATIGGVPNTIIAGAASRVRGIDLEAAGKITQEWSLLAGFVLMDPRVTKSYTASNVGLPLANIARRSFNLLTKYEFTPWFELGGQAVYASTIQGGSLLAANQPTYLPSHWRFDTFAEAKIGPNTALKLYVANIFNRTYYDSLYRSGTPFVAVAPGRSVTLIATAHF